MNKKVFYKIGIVILAIMQILNILGGLSSVSAEIKEGDTLVLKGDHECDSLVEYWMTDYNKWSYKVVWYVYYIDSKTGEKYPAFCVEPAKQGVGTGYTEYATTLSKEKNAGIWRVLSKGYMGTTYKDWNLECDDDLYSATKIALHSYVQNISPKEKYRIGTRSVDGNTVEEIQRRAIKVLDVAQLIYTHGINGTEKYEEPQISVSQYGEKNIEILNGVEYYTQKYKVNANKQLISYEIEINNLVKGTKILNLNNQEISTQTDSYFKIAIPTKNIKEEINGNILIKNAKVKTCPIYYCKSSIQNAQSYVTYTAAYETTNGNIGIKIKNDNCNLQILKVDSETNKPLENVTFEISKENGERIGEYTTDKNGLIEIKNLEPGIVRVKEIKVDDKYILNEEEKQVSLEWGKTAKIQIENSRKKGNLRIIKVDAENNEILLENVKFKLYDSNDNFVEDVTTDAKGEAVIENLNIGDYYLQEVETDEKYILNKEKIQVTVKWNEETTVKIENEKAKGNIKIVKTSEDDNFINGKKAGSAIPGVVFEIFDIDGNSIEKIVTDENGIATSSKLELGKYRIKEIKANDDYELNGKEYIADITKNDETVEIGVTNKSKNKLPRTGF